MIRPINVLFTFFPTVCFVDRRSNYLIKPDQHDETRQRSVWGGGGFLKPLQFRWCTSFPFCVPPPARSLKLPNVPRIVVGVEQELPEGCSD
jgi:hypothetical protein